MFDPSKKVLTRAHKKSHLSEDVLLKSCCISLKLHSKRPISALSPWPGGWGEKISSRTVGSSPTGPGSEIEHLIFIFKTI